MVRDERHSVPGRSAREEPGAFEAIWPSRNANLNPAKLKPGRWDRILRGIGTTLLREPRRKSAVEHILCKVSL